MSRQYLHDELVSAADQLYSIVVHELKVKTKISGK